MNNQALTQDQKERYCHKVLFKVKGRLAMIHTFIENGMIIRMDDKYEYACACFDNTIDYNDFKDKIAHLVSA